MSGAARGPNHAAPTPAAATSGQILQPLKRHLAFNSTKPPFPPPDDYYRFSSPLSDARQWATTAADHEPDAVIFKSPVGLLLSQLCWLFELELLQSLGRRLINLLLGLELKFVPNSKSTCC